MKKEEGKYTESQNTKSKRKTANDPWYSKVVAKTGNVVSGGAALLVRTQALGGMDAIVHNVATAAATQATQAATAAYVQSQTGNIIEMPRKIRKVK